MRVALLVALTGCDYLFNIDRLPTSNADAGAPDSDAFDLSVCPGAYNEPLFPGSRYRISRGGEAWAHNEVCNSDAPGITHLAVIDSPDELAAFQARLDQGDMIWYLGAIQSRDALTASHNWRWITGEPVGAPPWAPNEPNDADDVEADHSEQHAIMWSTRTGLIDFHITTLDALCECDGRAVDPTVSALFDADRPP